MSPLNILKYSAGEMNYWVHLTVKSVISLLQGHFTINDLSGPIGVVDAIDQVVDETRDAGTVIMGMSLLNMLILLSANLGVMNLLPLPALDGRKAGLPSDRSCAQETHQEECGGDDSFRRHDAADDPDGLCSL